MSLYNINYFYHAVNIIQFFILFIGQILKKAREKRYKNFHKFG